MSDSQSMEVSVVTREPLSTQLSEPMDTTAPLQAKLFGQTSTTAPRAALGNITNNVKTTNREALKPLKAVQPTSRVQVYKDVESRPTVGPKETTPSVPVSKESVHESPMAPSEISSIHSSPRTSRRCQIVIPNLDDKASNSSMCAEYAQEIDAHLREAELRTRPKPYYMRKQQDLDARMRSILVDWLMEVALEYKMVDETVYLAVNFMDRFLSQMAVLRGKLQLVGTAAMLISSKFEEIYAPEVSEFVYITDDTYTRQQVLKMESLMIKTLGFDFCAVTPLDYLNRFIRALQTTDPQVTKLARFLSDIALIDYRMVQYAPSLIATAVCVYSNYILHGKGWDDSIEHYSGYTWAQVLPCLRDLQKSHEDQILHPSTTCLEKHIGVSNIAPKSGEPPNNATVDCGSTSSSLNITTDSL